MPGPARRGTWTASSAVASDIVTTGPATRLAVLIGAERTSFADGDDLPLFYHWLYAPDPIRPEDAGPDGHPRLGGFLPPFHGRRRLFAGCTLDVHRPLHFGDSITRTSQVTAVEEKAGRSGPLVFVSVETRIDTDRGPALVETRQLVFRGTDGPDGAGNSGGRKAAPAGTIPWSRRVTPSLAMLFGYSALTYNGHRIHYDHGYATGVEGYRDLVVHGPLIATLLADLAARYDPRTVRRAAFRALAPSFCGDALTLSGGPDGPETPDSAVLAAEPVPQPENDGGAGATASLRLDYGW